MKIEKKRSLVKGEKEKWREIPYALRPVLYTTTHNC